MTIPTWTARKQSKLITSASAFKEDPCLVIEAVATAHGTFFFTVHAILHQG
jgi:hypothetical protein